MHAKHPDPFKTKLFCLHLPFSFVFLVFFFLMFQYVSAFFSVVFSLLSFSFSLSHLFVFCFPPPPLPLSQTWAEPSAPPQDIKCSSSSSTTLLVSWRPPPVESQNGALAGYTVRYAVVGGGAEVNTEPVEEPAVPPSSNQIQLQRLEKWTLYRVTVAASTSVGPGPESEPLLCRTDEDGNLFSSWNIYKFVKRLIYLRNYTVYDTNICFHKLNLIPSFNLK